MRFPVCPALYAVCVGALMILMWAPFILTGQVPELASRPAAIGLHLAAEAATAVALMAGGAACLARRRWGPPILLFALGMLAYALIVSPGYYLEAGQGGFAVMFGFLLALTAVFLAPAVRWTLQPRAAGQEPAGGAPGRTAGG